jgi:hypothetical protein
MDSNQMSDERAERCDRCRFWDCVEASANGEDDPTGICRKSAPPAITLPHGVEQPYRQWAVWPLTLCSEWCGEFQPSRQPANGLALQDVILSNRAFHCLWHGGIRTVEQLTGFYPDELLEIRNLGMGTLAEIKESLARHGLTLRQR